MKNFRSSQASTIPGHTDAKGTDLGSHPHYRYITAKVLSLWGLVILSLTCGLAFSYFEPQIVLIGVIVLVLAVLIFIQPWLGALVYLTFQYASVALMYPTLQPMQLGKIIIAYSFACWLLHNITGSERRFVKDRVLWVLSLWLAVAYFSHFFAIDAERALNGTAELGAWIIIYLLIVNSIDSLPKWQWTVGLLLLLNLKMSQFQIRAYITGLGTTQHSDYFIKEGLGLGNTSFFGNAGDFGVAMCVIVPLAFFFIHSVRSRVMQAGGLAAFACFAVSIIMSGARGNTLSLFVMASIFAWRSSRRAIAIIVVVLIGLAWWLGAPDVVTKRFASGFRQQDATSLSRLELWQAGANMFLSHPLTGVGIYNYRPYYQAHYRSPSSFDRDLEPHNIFVQAGADLGIWGLACLVSVIVIIFRRNRTTRELASTREGSSLWFHNFAHALDYGLIGYLVAGSFLSVLQYPHLYILLALTISLHNIACRTLGPEGKPEKNPTSPGAKPDQIGLEG